MQGQSTTKYGFYCQETQIFYVIQSIHNCQALFQVSNTHSSNQGINLQASAIQTLPPLASAVPTNPPNPTNLSTQASPTSPAANHQQNDPQEHKKTSQI